MFKFDIKTHNIDAKFSMPNLISVKRLNKYLQDDKNQLIYIFVDYAINDNIVVITDIKVFHIYQLNWDCLHIQNLGKGQLQIKNSLYISINKSNNRNDWHIQLKSNIEIFYKKLIESIQKEIKLL